ncbi:MAG: hypothetical protein HZC42_10430 [Candidatus Eisenbacteria bacterium]|nr:hypothetical protein [Candidatus Eisenbacteria bacterium]
MKRIAVLLGGAVLFAALAVPGRGADQNTANWRLVPGGHPIPANDSLSLFNLTARKFLVWSPRRFGINLRYVAKAGRGFSFVRASKSDEPLTYGEPLAIRQRSGRFLHHAKRRFGVDLAWSGTPVYEWEIGGGGGGTVVGADTARHTQVSLFNTHAGAYLVYGERGPGVNLVWKQ